jgi:hypothetical protein
MTENEQFQHYRLMPPWRRWLIIAFGISLPVFFGAVGCSFIVASRAPLWAMAIGVILGLGWGIVWGTSKLFAPNSKKMRFWLGGISAATLLISPRLTAEWAIPRHPVSLAFSAGYVFSWAVGVFVGTLFFNAVAARLRA